MLTRHKHKSALLHAAEFINWNYLLATVTISGDRHEVLVEKEAISVQGDKRK